METHRSLGDGKSQTNTAGQPPASVIQAIERLKELGQRIWRNTWSGITHTNHSFGASHSHFAGQINLHRCPLLRVANRISHHVFDRAVQERRISANFPISFRDIRLHVAMARLGFEVRVISHICD